MFNPLNKIIKDFVGGLVNIEKIVEVTGEATTKIIQTSNLPAKNSNESEESYKARLEHLQNKENPLHRLLGRALKLWHRFL